MPCRKVTFLLTSEVNGLTLFVHQRPRRNSNFNSCNTLLQLTHWSGRSVKIELLERAIELDDEFAVAWFDGKPCPKSTKLISQLLVSPGIPMLWQISGVNYLEWHMSQGCRGVLSGRACGLLAVGSQFAVKSPILRMIIAPFSFWRRRCSSGLK